MEEKMKIKPAKGGFYRTRDGRLADVNIAQVWGVVEEEEDFIEWTLDGDESKHNSNLDLVEYIGLENPKTKQLSQSLSKKQMKEYKQ